ncbi:hypothetical protein [Bacillus alveayuensis]|nr:hypothetical protein [Bacillus alveayuensis]
MLKRKIILIWPSPATRYTKGGTTMAYFRKVKTKNKKGYIIVSKEQ